MYIFPVEREREEKEDLVFKYKQIKLKVESRWNGCHLSETRQLNSHHALTNSVILERNRATDT